MYIVYNVVGLLFLKVILKVILYQVSNVTPCHRIVYIAESHLLIHVVFGQ